MNYCPDCGEPLSSVPGAAFCPGCGSPLPDRETGDSGETPNTVVDETLTPTERVESMSESEKDELLHKVADETDDPAIAGVCRLAAEAGSE
jgi:uncharacterized Zn finger protein (UPF0148 family)